SCPPELLSMPSFHSIPSLPSEFSKDTVFGYSKQHGGADVRGWIGEKGYDPGFDIKSFQMKEQLKYRATEIKTGGLLNLYRSTAEPVTLTKTSNHAFHII